MSALMYSEQLAMEQIALATGLQFDGGDDNRLFAHTNRADTLCMTEEQYDRMEEDLESFLIEGEGFNVYAWNDMSGYDYWTLNMQEDNYIQITVSISNPLLIDTEALQIAVELAFNKFCKYMGD